MKAGDVLLAAQTHLLPRMQPVVTDSFSECFLSTCHVPGSGWALGSRDELDQIRPYSVDPSLWRARQTISKSVNTGIEVEEG